MFEELESVVLAHDINNHSLRKGDVGVIVFVYDNGAAYEVEFMTSAGRTIGVFTLASTDLRPKVYKEILNTNWVSGNLNYTAFGTAYYPNESTPAEIAYSGISNINTRINKEESGTEIFANQTA